MIAFLTFVFILLCIIVIYAACRCAGRADDYWDDVSPGWLCRCGHWQDDDFHCDCCGAEPPQGCDCGFCEERRYERYLDDAEWLDDWANYPAYLLAGELKDEEEDD